MNTATDETERKVILEFCHLLEKSKQLFNGLRELPQYGHKQWHSYFGRTFDVYTKLWKFQQQHRTILDTKYGLKRWQIGEIASKIGQLYYHFYLRTSEYAYLNEAFSFYYAIRGRCYYTQACKEDKSELMVKKLRYYARFIVVCLLLKKPKLVRELAKELEKQIYEYGKTYDPDDQVEWNVVMEEVKSFLQAEPVVSVVHPDNYSIVLTNRITPHQTPPVERTPHMTLILQEILVVGSTTHQVKFSEMTMDMYRIIQTFERETSARSSAELPLHDDSPRQRYGSTPSAPTHRGYNIDNGPRYENPHKYLLFRPTASQVLVYLASGMNDLAPNGVLLLYLSADKQMAALKHYEEEVYDNGGPSVPGREHHKDREKITTTVHLKEPQCLHPTDLAPFTRRPLFIIVDSDNSYVFQQVPRPFGQPLVVLMSPSEMPATFFDRKHQGNMLTLFLHSPLAAFSFICEIYTISLAQWDRADSYVDAFMAEASMVISRHRTIDFTYLTFFGDDFLRIILVRYVFCEMSLRMHRAFRGRDMLTRASPPLPEDVFDHPALIHILLDLSSYLQVRSHFQEPGATGPPTAKETIYNQ